MRKVLIPIYLKLVLFVLIITAVSLSAYVYYAIDLFKNDKIAYVFESVDDYNEKSYTRLRDQLDSVKQNLNQIIALNYNSDFITNTLKQHENISAYFEFKKAKLQKLISFLDKDQLASIYKLDPGQLNSQEFYLLDDNIFVVKKLNSATVGLMVNLEAFKAQSESVLFENEYLLKQSPVNPFQTSLMTRLKKSNSFGQSFLVEGEESFVVSVRELSKDFIVITKSDYHKALFASAVLRSNSLYFGLLVIGLVIIFVLIYSQIFTRPINKLTQMVGQFMSSDFKSRANVRTRDEIGYLADSFNKMADDINVYMSEMEEKLRLEEEIKTANLVQSQFFPQTTYEDHTTLVHGYYTSASECGGDWWGVYEADGWSVLIVADVTGHGTPAALMTAVLHSSLNSLSFLSKMDSSYLSDSAKIMDFLNKSFTNSTSRLNATAFVMCLNKETLQANYANASHNPPFLLPIHQGEVTKSEIVPLIQEICPRLGESKEHSYKSSEIRLVKKDKVIFYTDGLLEGVNLEDKAYGQRKFLKSLLAEQDRPVNDIIDEVIANFYNFVDGAALKDDITLVGLEIKS